MTIENSITEESDIPTWEEIEKELPILKWPTE